MGHRGSRRGKLARQPGAEDQAGGAPIKEYRAEEGSSQQAVLRVSGAEKIIAQDNDGGVFQRLPGDGEITHDYGGSRVVAKVGGDLHQAIRFAARAGFRGRHGDAALKNQ